MRGIEPGTLKKANIMCNSSERQDHPRALYWGSGDNASNNPCEISFLYTLGVAN